MTLAYRAYNVRKINDNLRFFNSPGRLLRKPPSFFRFLRTLRGFDRGKVL